MAPLGVFRSSPAMHFPSVTGGGSAEAMLADDRPDRSRGNQNVGKIFERFDRRFKMVERRQWLYYKVTGCQITSVSGSTTAAGR